jgi:hypothetical protein
MLYVDAARGKEEICVAFRAPAEIALHKRIVVISWDGLWKFRDQTEELLEFTDVGGVVEEAQLIVSYFEIRGLWQLSGGCGVGTLNLFRNKRTMELCIWRGQISFRFVGMCAILIDIEIMHFKNYVLKAE